VRPAAGSWVGRCGGETGRREGAGGCDFAPGRSSGRTDQIRPGGEGLCDGQSGPRGDFGAVRAGVDELIVRMALRRSPYLPACRLEAGAKKSVRLLPFIWLQSASRLLSWRPSANFHPVSPAVCPRARPVRDKMRHKRIVGSAAPTAGYPTVHARK